MESANAAREGQHTHTHTRYKSTGNTNIVDFVHPRVQLLVAFACEVVRFALCPELKAVRLHLCTCDGVDVLEKDQGDALASLL